MHRDPVDSAAAGTGEWRREGSKASKFVVGTHHKTGSKFFSQSLKTLRKKSGLRL
jgi:hypothetical protein